MTMNNARRLFGAAGTPLNQNGFFKFFPKFGADRIRHHLAIDEPRECATTGTQPKHSSHPRLTDYGSPLRVVDDVAIHVYAKVLHEIAFAHSPQRPITPSF